MRREQKTYHIVTFGCQMNERDSETLAGMLEEMGYEHTRDSQSADVVLFNTCSVRENADKRFFGVLGQWKNTRLARPDMTVGVCGCMMQLPHIVEEIHTSYPWVDLVFGTHNLHRFPSLFSEHLREKASISDVWEEGGPVVEPLVAKRMYPFKAYVNIMYGCDNFCTYCIVPYTRGRERSRHPDDILREVRLLAQSGTKEVTLLGQNVNSYGKSRYGASPADAVRAEEMGFAGLLRKIDEIPGIERIRFMTSHPKDISQELIQVFGECEHVCRHIHLPVQSGSDAILKEMNRKYTSKQYMDIIDALRRQCPDIAVTTDLIVGFPGETEQHFQETLDLVERVRYDAAFTFLYSPREGTHAASRKDSVPDEVKSDRFDRLLQTLHRIQGEKSRRYEGQTVPVLVEGPSRTNPDTLTGRTEALKVVDFKGRDEWIGHIVPVKITRAGTFSLRGEVVL